MLREIRHAVIGSVVTAGAMLLAAGVLDWQGSGPLRGEPAPGAQRDVASAAPGAYVRSTCAATSIALMRTDPLDSRVRRGPGQTGRRGGKGADEVVSVALGRPAPPMPVCWREPGASSSARAAAPPEKRSATASPSPR